jgi:5S rRNA maturation endonuclease (ribonuclease M5)
MTRPSSTWQRVSRSRLCPVCKKPDWCLYAGDPGNPTAAICARVESRNRRGEAGWFHGLRDGGGAGQRRRRVIRRSVGVRTAPTEDLAEMAGNCQFAATADAVAGLASELGVTPASLRRLSLGWSAKHTAWTFPMRDAHDNVLGIRLRLPDGRKLSVPGGREGLFIPGALDYRGRLLIGEGPTDTAALLDLGFDAVGRASCTGGAKLLVEFMRRHQPAEVVIVADADAPGQRGARKLAANLAAYCRAVRVITPPAGVKDAREWKRHGVTHADVEAAINVTPLWKLKIETRQGKKGDRHGR